jgi:hypothetical protein
MYQPAAATQGLLVVGCFGMQGKCLPLHVDVSAPPCVELVVGRMLLTLADYDYAWCFTTSRQNDMILGHW